MSTIRAVETPVRETPAVGPEPTTPIRPSEALRLGRLIYPIRIEGDWINQQRRAACAVGAMMAGYGVDRVTSELFPPFDMVAACPVDGCESRRWSPSSYGPNHPLDDTVAHVNDQHHWNDDEIVAWLESLGL